MTVDEARTHMSLWAMAASPLIVGAEIPNMQAQNLAAASQTQQPAANVRGYIQKSAELEGLIMILKVTPGNVGENTFEIGLGSEFGAIGEVQDVRLDFVNKDANTGQSRLELPLSGSAKYSASAANLSLPGDWTITATVRRRGVDDVRATFTLPITAGDQAAPSATTASESIWGWPFHGARSYGAIAALIAGVAAALAVGVWQYRELRETR